MSRFPMTQLAGILLLTATLFSCSDGKKPAAEPQENQEAKAMMQGIWLNSDDDDVAFLAKGDTIHYPDSTSQPVCFRIVADTLIMQGAYVVKYPIVRQTPNQLVFLTQGGERVRLVKSNNPDDAFSFEPKRPAEAIALNQRQLIKRDTIVSWGDNRYHCYVQVNPTTYKVFKTSYNDDGLEVENVYYDNIIHLSVFHGAQKVYSSNFYKKDFANRVPAEYIQQGVLNNFEFGRIDAQGVHYNAQLCIPDSPSSFVVEVSVGFDGRMQTRVAE